MGMNEYLGVKATGDYKHVFGFGTTWDGIKPFLILEIE
jgi:hypothetical protein